MNPLLPLVILLLLIVLGLICYASHLLDQREKLLHSLESTIAQCRTLGNHR